MEFSFFVALGSNLQNPTVQLLEARKRLNSFFTELQPSSLYQTPPWGFVNQDDFINAVIKFKSPLNPFEVLEILQKIENEMGRVRSFKYAPRLIDLDLLTYEDLEINTEKLTIPHPLIKERAFVLIPLLEIAPQLEIKGQGIVKDLANKCDRMGINKIFQPLWKF